MADMVRAEVVTDGSPRGQSRRRGHRHEVSIAGSAKDLLGRAYTVLAAPG